MAEPLEDAFSGDTDPLSDPVGDGGVADDTTSPVGDDEPGLEGQESVEDGGNEDGDNESQTIEGTPFKDQAALAQGYKNIQRLVAAKDKRIAQIERQLEIAVNAIQKFSGSPKGEGTKTPGFAIPKGDAFWQEMAKDPAQFLQRIVQAEAERLIEERVGGKLSTIESSVQGFQRNSLVQSFLSSHPGFTQEDEEEMVEVLEAHPQLKELPGGLDLAYNTVVANRAKAEGKSNARTSAVAGAKSVAGLAGKKTSLPSSQAKKKDAFDDVLELDANERQLYKLGRK